MCLCAQIQVVSGIKTARQPQIVRLQKVKHSYIFLIMHIFGKLEDKYPNWLTFLFIEIDWSTKEIVLTTLFLSLPFLACNDCYDTIEKPLSKIHTYSMVTITFRENRLLWRKLNFHTFPIYHLQCLLFKKLPMFIWQNTAFIHSSMYYFSSEKMWEKEVENVETPQQEASDIRKQT